ncbi:methionyl-tRNA formyltransferase [Candidatus Uhrbacteria bacterium]|nr:methionyl-tRNA formyltransferase [Candidatus Uhrbacteria bacterium]
MTFALLFGTPTFALPVAETLQRTSACTLIGVVTKPDEPVGRQRVLTAPPLATWARECGARCWQPKTKVELTALLRELQPDVAVIAAYGRFIPPEALTISRFGFVNIHPSLLPRWRGPSPVQAAIAAGDAETGVTCILLDREMDHGPIIGQERIPIAPTRGRVALERELAERGAQLLERILPEYLAGRMTPRPQDDAQATTCPLLARDDGRLDWREPTIVLERRIRAYEGWPGTWCADDGGRRLKVLRATIGGPTSAAPGTIVREVGQFGVACGDDRTLILEIVQTEGRAPVPGGDFLRGYRGSDHLPCAP